MIIKKLNRKQLNFFSVEIANNNNNNNSINHASFLEYICNSFSLHPFFFYSSTPKAAFNFLLLFFFKKNSFSLGIELLYSSFSFCLYNRSDCKYFEMHILFIDETRKESELKFKICILKKKKRKNWLSFFLMIDFDRVK